MKSEFYFIALVDQMIKAGKASTKVLSSDAKWFGVTYQEDIASVRQMILDKIADGTYPQQLWAKK